MDQNKDQWIRNFKNIAVKMTDGSIIKGKINIGENKRLSQLFKISEDNFVTLVSEGSEEGSKKVFMVNKNYIMWAESED